MFMNEKKKIFRHSCDRKECLIYQEYLQQRILLIIFLY